MKYFYKILPIIIMFFIFTGLGCSTFGVTPKTNSEKLLQVKLTYEAILDTALKYQKGGLLTEVQEAKLSKAFKDFHDAEVLADTALSLKNLTSFNNQMETMQSIINIINAINSNPLPKKGVKNNVNNNRSISIGFSSRLFDYCNEISRSSEESKGRKPGSGCSRISEYHKFKRKQTFAFRSQ